MLARILVASEDATSCSAMNASNCSCKALLLSEYEKSIAFLPTSLAHALSNPTTKTPRHEVHIPLCLGVLVVGFSKCCLEFSICTPLETLTCLCPLLAYISAYISLFCTRFLYPDR